MIGNLSEDLDEYAESVLKLYLQLPETPLKASSNDKRTVENLYARLISLATIESALLLGSLRRLIRSPELPPLSPIRSLAYFLPVIQEVLAMPFPHGYLEYLRSKMRSMTQCVSTANRQVFK
jgi:hypothetical protein